MRLVHPGRKDPLVVWCGGMFWSLSPGSPTTSQNPDSSSSEIGVTTQTPPAASADVIQSSRAPMTKKVPTSEEQDADGWRRRRKLTWAKLIQKVYEIDPLLCRFCGTEMKIISFITEYPVIKKILTHINYESQPPEPLAHSPPLFQDTVYVPF